MPLDVKVCLVGPRLFYYLLFSPAIDAQIARQDRLREKMLKQMQQHTIVIQTDGVATAQVNGLSVIDLGSFAFGQPARITATVHLGEGEVRVKDGMVTLGGHVPAYADKWGVEKATKNVFGVRAVANEIDVKPATPRTDQEIAAAALNALKANVSVPVSDIKVLVSDGWMTLEGKVRFWHQRNAAEEAVRSLWGVKGTNDAIEIHPQVDAGDIWSKIHTAFKRHADLDADKVTVTVHDDTVTLTGEVHSWHGCFFSCLRSPLIVSAPSCNDTFTSSFFTSGSSASMRNSWSVSLISANRS